MFISCLLSLEGAKNKPIPGCYYTDTLQLVSVCKNITVSPASMKESCLPVKAWMDAALWEWTWNTTQIPWSYLPSLPQFIQLSQQLVIFPTLIPSLRHWSYLCNLLCHHGKHLPGKWEAPHYHQFKRAVWLWTSHLSCLGLNLKFCKMGKCIIKT